MQYLMYVLAIFVVITLLTLDFAPQDNKTYTGYYTGRLDAEDKGKLNLSVAHNYIVRGSVQTGKLGRFEVDGILADRGRAVFSGTNLSGEEVRFVGDIELKTGKIYGVWYASNNKEGTFSGRKNGSIPFVFWQSPAKPPFSELYTENMIGFQPNVLSIDTQQPSNLDNTGKRTLIYLK